MGEARMRLAAALGRVGELEEQVADLTVDLAEAERERDEAREQWRIEHAERDRAWNRMKVAQDEATTLRADLAHARAEVERLRAVVDAARRLRDSGYDGPFIGEPVEELFTALATIDGAGEST